MMSQQIVLLNVVGCYAVACLVGSSTFQLHGQPLFFNV